MKKLRIALVAMVAGMAGSCSVCASADTGPTSPGPVLPPTADPPVVLKIYPKLLPLQPGDRIITSRPPRPFMEEQLPSDPKLRAKDTRTWA